MTKSLFEEEWFSWHSMAGLRAKLHGKDGAKTHENQIISQILSRLLYDQRDDKDLKEIIDYFALCASMSSISNAQIFQDLWVLAMTKEKRGGYFVEFGACDGSLLSNTLLLERAFGWTGILAEPNPVWHEKLKSDRTSHICDLCVDAASGRKIAFAAVSDMPELSRIDAIVPHDKHEANGNRTKSKVIDVETISLMDLLYRYDAPKQIDYLSIDTEGSEFEILKEFDFGSYSFSLITVEHAGEKAKREAIRGLLEGHGYRRWFPAMSRWDDWYVLGS